MFTFSFTTEDLCLALSFGEKDGSFPFSLGLNSRLDLGALGPKLGSLGYTLRSHSVVDRFTRCRWQVSPSNTHVDHHDPEILRLSFELDRYPGHYVFAVARQHVAQQNTTNLRANRRIQNAAKNIDEVGFGIRTQLEAQRRYDLVANESIDVDALLVGKNDFLGRRVKAQHALFVIAHRLPRQLKVKSRVGLLVTRLTEF